MVITLTVVKNFISSQGHFRPKCPREVEAGEQDACAHEQLELPLFVEGDLAVCSLPHDVEQGDDGDEDVEDGVLDRVPERTVHLVEAPISGWNL